MKHKLLNEGNGNNSEQTRSRIIRRAAELYLDKKAVRENLKAARLRKTVKVTKSVLP